MTLEETRVVIPTITHTHIDKGDAEMTALIATADRIGLHSVAEWFRNLRADLAYRSKVNATIKELSKLSDRELNDIGIARGEIWSIAHSVEEYERAQANVNLKGWV